MMHVQHKINRSKKELPRVFHSDAKFEYKTSLKHHNPVSAIVMTATEKALRVKRLAARISWCGGPKAVVSST
jgi:hypothetical protein